MITGPKPKPAEIAERQGNPGHRPLVRSPAAGAPLDTTAPDWLDDLGRAYWQANAGRLRALGFVKQTDLGAFARLCDHVSRWHRCRLRVNERGESYTTESKHGSMDRINPDFAAMLRLESVIQALEDRFGLTPAARQQILARLAEPPPSGDLGLAVPTGHAPAGSPLGLFAPRTTEGSGGPH